jgi:hypothetical protein
MCSPSTAIIVPHCCYAITAIWWNLWGCAVWAICVFCSVSIASLHHRANLSKPRNFSFERGAHLKISLRTRSIRTSAPVVVVRYVVRGPTWSNSPNGHWMGHLRHSKFVGREKIRGRWRSARTWRQNTLPADSKKDHY